MPFDRWCSFQKKIMPKIQTLYEVLHTLNIEDYEIDGQHTVQKFFEGFEKSLSAHQGCIYLVNIQ